MSSSSAPLARPAVFLDRDGTVNRDYGYVHTADRFEFLPGAPEAIGRLNDAGHWVFIVTNQSGVARGYYPEADVVRLHEHMSQLLATRGAHIDAYYYCPYHPEGQASYRRESPYRKPGAGMFERACRDFPVQRELSWMIGNKPEDMHFSVNARLRAVLVTGETTSLSPNAATPQNENAPAAVSTTAPTASPARASMPPAQHAVRPDLAAAVQLILTSNVAVSAPLSTERVSGRR